MKTTTKLATTLFGLMMCSTMYAQNLYFRGGANLSTMYGMDAGKEFGEEQKWKPGFHFGLGFDYYFNDELSIQSGLGVTGRGTKFESSFSEEFDGEMVTYSTKLSASIYYLELPLALRYRYALNENTGIFMEAGAYVGLGLKGKIKWELEFHGETETEEGPVDWNWIENRVDVGFTVGVGVEVRKFQLGVYGDYGLLPVFDDGIGHQNLRLSLGYKIFSAK